MTPLDLKTDIRYIKGVGENRAKLMAKLGINTLGDLAVNFPRTYEDRTVIKPIAELVHGETVCIEAVVATAPRLSHIRNGLDLVKLSVVDDAGRADITFFNRSFVKNELVLGNTYFFFGKVQRENRKIDMLNPIFESAEFVGASTRRIVPVYPLTAGISQKVMANAVRQALNACDKELPDALPTAVRERFELCETGFAYENVHFPRDAEMLEIARRRLIFEELFVLAAAMVRFKGARRAESGRRLTYTDAGEFLSALPFELTGAQKRAISEAVSDMTSGLSMARLVQGDVGSGKTAVAAACCWLAWKSGYQSAFMAPTEILARQHFETLSGMLEPFGMKIGLLTGGLTAKQKRDVAEKLSLGEIDLVIGTHAIISEGVRFNNLALAVTDEQHRFGVDQRALLTQKGDSPHVLVMSATPIPRTLALIIYGDLDVSVIDELPPGRKEVETFVVKESHRKRIYDFIRRLVSEGRQVYIVCPMVEESESVDEDLKAAIDYSETLGTEVFPDLRVALVHGKMKTKDKTSVMTSFFCGETDILVATTVIEVGVDNPNAALIVVENADRFGLSQLHQLRGRVGRGEDKSYCVLFEGSGGAVSRERLNVMRETNDGFKISEEDLRLRGPGDFFGSRQHGLPEMHIANLVADMDVLTSARDAAAAVLCDDPELEKPENKGLLNKIDEMFMLSEGKLN